MDATTSALVASLEEVLDHLLDGRFDELDEQEAAAVKRAEAAIQAARSLPSA